jgi:L-rhamnonate dehydratase
VALAAAYDISIIPHGSSIYSYHLHICFPNCPMAEFLIMSPKADSIGEDKIHILRHLFRSRSLNSFLGSLLSPVSFFGDLFTDEPLPKDGYIELAHDKPGFGVTLNR